MNIYVLIICCLWTLKGCAQLFKEAEEKNNLSGIVAGLIIVAAGVIGIIFQSHNI